MVARQDGDAIFVVGRPLAAVGFIPSRHHSKSRSRFRYNRLWKGYINWTQIWNISFVSYFLNNYRSHSPKFKSLLHNFIQLLSILLKHSIPSFCTRLHRTSPNHYDDANNNISESKFMGKYVGVAWSWSDWLHFHDCWAWISHPLLR